MKPNEIKCVCGKVGFSDRKMLQCSKCQRWYHEECVKCLAMPMMAGDSFFIFICSMCNFGSEYLARMEMRWSDVIHLVLYNLSVENKKKYFDLDKIIMPFLDENWKRFQLIGSIADVKTEKKRDKVIAALEGHSKRFMSAKEIRKKKTLWGLRVHVAPKTPKVVPNAARIKENHIVWEFDVNGRKYKSLNEKVSESKSHASNGKSRVKLKLPAVTANGRTKNILEVSKCHGSAPDAENGALKTAKQKIKRTLSNSIVLNEDSARYGLLDSLIPVPKDFDRNNNPFRKPGIAVHCSKRKIHLDFTKSQEKTNKRRPNGENSFNFSSENGNHYPFVENVNHLYRQSMNSDCKTNEPLLHATNDCLSHSVSAQNENFCIIGKRVTNVGVTQYLLEWNR